MKVIFKNILAFIILVFSVLCVMPACVGLLIASYFRAINDYLDGKKPLFPKIFSKEAWCEIKKDIKEYFNCKLWEQALGSIIWISCFYFLTNWVFFTKNKS